jgi:hypothetical protein
LAARQSRGYAILRKVWLNVEGGNDKYLDMSLKNSMRSFLRELDEALRGIGWSLKIDMKHSRDEAFKAFLHPLQPDPTAYRVLLVDAEAPIAPNHDAKQHLRSRDGWDTAAHDAAQFYLMVQMMESWFLADLDALEDYFGHGYRPNAIPKRNDIEAIPKDDVESHIDSATIASARRKYHKGRHSADLLAKINPQLVRQKSPHCERLFTELPAAVTKL